MKEFPRREEISKFIKSNPRPVVLTDPFPSQQQLIDHISNQGTSSSMEEIRMMSSDTINLNTCSNWYDNPIRNKDKIPSSEKVASTSSPPSMFNGPLIIEKPNLDLILRPPKSTFRKAVFKHNSQAAKFYNVVEYLA